MKVNFHDDGKPTLIGVLWLYGYLFVYLTLQERLEEKVWSFLPESYIGTEAVKQIHDYLILWFFGRILCFLIPSVLLMLSYFILRLKQRKKLISSSTKFVLILSLIVSGLLDMQVRHFNHFEFQMEQNHYFGTRFMKTAQLILDIEKDLQSDEAETISAKISCTDQYYLNTDREYRRSNYFVYEYALQNAEDQLYIGQISGQDSRQIKELDLRNISCQVKICPNSGLILSIDE